MKVVIQRVSKASCEVEGSNPFVSTIGPGLMLLVSFTAGDGDQQIDKMAQKIVNLRIFDDSDHKMNLSLKDIFGEILSISQFTLYGNCDKGNRPSFVDSLKADQAMILYHRFNQRLEQLLNKPITTGVFGAHMILKPICDGPVTICLEYQ